VYAEPPSYDEPSGHLLRGKQAPNPDGGIRSVQAVAAGASRKERSLPNDQFDVSLEDTDLLEEVELVTHLMVASTSSDGPLSQDQIDELLGIPRPRPGD
jgi:hypothetical protein